MDGQRSEAWPLPLLPSPLLAGYGGPQPGPAGLSMWTSRQSPLSDWRTAVDLSLEFPRGALGVKLGLLSGEQVSPHEGPDEASSAPQGPAHPAHQHQRDVAYAAPDQSPSPLKQLRRHWEAASAPRSSPSRPAHLATPASPSGFQQQLHDEAEAILSDFRQALSRSMNLRDSVTRLSMDSSNGGGGFSNGISGGTGGSAVPLDYMNDATALLGGGQVLEGSGGRSGSGPQLDALLASGGRSKGPQRQLHWQGEEDGDVQEQEEPQQRYPTGRRASETGETSRRQGDTRQLQRRGNGSGGGSGIGSRSGGMDATDAGGLRGSAKGAPPKRLSLVLPTASATSTASTATASTQQLHPDIAPRRSDTLAVSGSQLYRHHAGEQKQQRQPQELERTRHAQGYPAGPGTSQLVDYSPSSLSLQHTSQAASDVADEPHQHERRGRAQPATPDSFFVQQEPGDLRGGALLSPALPPALQRPPPSPPPPPVASVTPDWAAGAGRGAVAQQHHRPIGTPQSEAASSGGCGFGSSVSGGPVPWPDAATPNSNTSGGGNQGQSEQASVAKRPARQESAAGIATALSSPAVADPYASARGPGADAGFVSSPWHGSAADSPNVPQCTDLSALLESPSPGSCSFPTPSYVSYASAVPLDGDDAPAVELGFLGFSATAGAVPAVGGFPTAAAAASPPNGFGGWRDASVDDGLGGFSDLLAGHGAGEEGQDEDDDGAVRGSVEGYWEASPPIRNHRGAGFGGVGEGPDDVSASMGGLNGLRLNYASPAVAPPSTGGVSLTASAAGFSPGEVPAESEQAALGGIDSAGRGGHSTAASSDGGVPTFSERPALRSWRQRMAAEVEALQEREDDEEHGPYTEPLRKFPALVPYSPSASTALAAPIASSATATFAAAAATAALAGAPDGAVPQPKQSHLPHGTTPWSNSSRSSAGGGGSSGGGGSGGLPQPLNLLSHEVSWASETERELVGELSRVWDASRRETHDAAVNIGVSALAAAVAAAPGRVAAAAAAAAEHDAQNERQQERGHGEEPLSQQQRQQHGGLVHGLPELDAASMTDGNFSFTRRNGRQPDGSSAYAASGAGSSLDIGRLALRRGGWRDAVALGGNVDLGWEDDANGLRSNGGSAGSSLSGADGAGGDVLDAVGDEVVAMDSASRGSDAAHWQGHHSLDALEGVFLGAQAAPPGGPVYWQIQENPAFEDSDSDSLTTPSSASLGDTEGHVQQQPQGVGVGDRSPPRAPHSPSEHRLLSMAAGSVNAAEGAFPHGDLSLKVGSRVSTQHASTADLPLSTVAAAGATLAANAGRRFAAAPRTGGTLSPHHPSVLSHGASTANGDAAHAEHRGTGTDSDDSDSPRTCALHRMLGSGVSPSLRELQGRLGLLPPRDSVDSSAGDGAEETRGFQIDGGGRNYDGASVFGARDANAAAGGTRGTEHRGAASSVRVRFADSANAVGSGGSVTPCTSAAATAAGLDPEVRALVLELEHAQSQLLVVLAPAVAAATPGTTAAATPLAMTPTPPPPTASSSLLGAASAATRTTGTATAPHDYATPIGSGAHAAVDASAGGTPHAPAASLASGFSTRSGRTTAGSAPPLAPVSAAAQVASVAVAKALARLVKLSRENGGLTRANEQLRGEFSRTSAAQLELQARNKLLYAMLAERGREVEHQAQSHQRRLMKLESQLTGSQQRVRQLERLHTQLSLEGQQAGQRAEAAQAHAAEAMEAAEGLREQVVALGASLYAARAEGAAAASEEGRVRRAVEAREEQLKVEKLIASCAEAETRAQQLQSELRATKQAGAQRTAEAEAVQRAAEAAAADAESRAAQLGEEAADMAERLWKLDAQAEHAAGETAQMQHQLDAAREAMAELTAERVAARGEAIRKDSDVAQALGAAAVAEAAAAVAREMEQRAQVAAAESEVAAAELREQLEAATWEAERRSVEEAEAGAREQALQEQLQTAVADGQAVRRELEDLRSAHTHLQEELHRNDCVAMDLVQQAEQAGVEAAEQAARVQHLQRQLEAQAATAAAAAAEHAAALGELEMALVAESARVMEEVGQREQLDATRGSELTALQGQLQDLQDQMRAALQAAQAERQRGEEEVVALVSQLQAVLVQQAEQQQQAEMQRQEVQDLQARLQEVQGERLREDAARAELVSMNASAQQQLMQLAAELAAAREQVESQRAVADEAQAAAAAAAERDDAASGLREQLTTAERRVAGLAQELAGAEATQRSLDSELQTVRSELAAALEAGSEAAARLQGAEQDKAALAERVRQLRQEMEEKSEQAGLAQERLVQVEAAMEGARGSAAEAEALLRQRLEVEEAARRELEALLNEQTAAGGQFEGEVAALHEQLLDLRESRARLKDDLDNATADLTSACAALAQREEELEAAQRASQEAAAAAATSVEAAGIADACAQAEAAARALAEAEAARLQGKVESEQRRAAELEAEVDVATRRLVDLQQRLQVAETLREQAQLAAAAAVVAAETAPAATVALVGRAILGSPVASVVSGMALAPVAAGRPSVLLPAVVEQRERLLLRSAAEVAAGSRDTTPTAMAAAAPAYRDFVDASTNESPFSRSRAASGDGHFASPAPIGSEPPSPACVQMAGAVVAAHAHLTDLRRRQDDAEELIALLERQAAEQRQRAEQAETELRVAEGQLAEARAEAAAQQRGAAEAQRAEAAMQRRLQEAETRDWDRELASRQQPWTLAGPANGGAGGSPSLPPPMSLESMRGDAVLGAVGGYGAGHRAGSGGGARSSSSNGGGADGVSSYMQASAFTSSTPFSLWVEPGSVGPTMGLLRSPLGGGEAPTPLFARSPGPLARASAPGDAGGSGMHMPYGLSSQSYGGSRPVQVSATGMGGFGGGAKVGGGNGGSGGGGGGVQLTVTLLELRYAVQQVEQAAGEMGTVLAAGGCGRDGARTGSAPRHMSACGALMTPTKPGMGTMGTGINAGLVISTPGSGRPLAMLPGNAAAEAAAEAALQERAWLTDSLASLTSRARSVAAQLADCLDAAITSRERVQAGGAGDVLSPMAVCSLQSELAGLRRQFEAAQFEAEQALEQQAQQHAVACSSLAADAAAYRQMVERLRQQLLAAEEAIQSERAERLEQQEEARLHAESLQRVSQQLASKCTGQEDAIMQLRHQLDAAASASGGSAGGIDRRPGIRAAGPADAEGHSAGGNRDGPGAAANRRTFREYVVSSPSGMTHGGLGHGGAGGGDKGGDGGDLSGNESEGSCGGVTGASYRGSGFAGKVDAPRSGGGHAVEVGAAGAAASQGPTSSGRTFMVPRRSPMAAATPSSSDYAHRSGAGGGGGSGGADSAVDSGRRRLSDDEVRLWAELLQLLAAGSASSASGRSSGGGAGAGDKAASASQLALVPQQDCSDGALVPIASYIGAGLSLQPLEAAAAASAAATTAEGRAALLARAVSHMQVLGAQNRKLVRLLHRLGGVGIGSSAVGRDGGSGALAAQLEALREENRTLASKYTAAQVAQQQGGLALQRLGRENRELHSQLQQQVRARIGDLEASLAAGKSAIGDGRCNE